MNKEQANKPAHWHAVNAEAVVDHLKSQPQGLGDDEARRRLEQHGPNRLSEQKRRGPLQRFLAQFHNVLIYILLVAAVMTGLLEQWIDTGVILAVVLINAIIGFIQEGKAEKALQAISAMMSQKATVRRNGQEQAIPAEQLVPGDVVLLTSGDKVPADIRLTRVRDLTSNEAALTGESVASEKGTDPVDEQAVPADRVGMAFSGTLVNSGRGEGIVVATGDDTEIGRIQEMVAETEQIATPLMQQVTRFGRYLSVAIILLAAALVLFGVFVRGYAWVEMFLAAVSVAVAAIPQGLPAIMTVTLAIGVRRMAARNAFIRRLPAVDTLGAVTVICSDKTGTLTRNEMMVQSLYSGDRTYEISGAGYKPEGQLTLNDEKINPEDHPALLETLRAGLLCNEADVAQDDQGRWQPRGDAMEAALIVAAMKAGMNKHDEQEQLPEIDAIPFESENQFMATLHKQNTRSLIYIKGAPEKILEMCERQRNAEGDDEPLEAEPWEQRAEELASRGQRLLAIAMKPANGERKLDFQAVQQGAVMLGLCGLIDPPRQEAIDAVHRCHEAGIRSKMVTGDHASTAKAIGLQLGIGDGETAMTGRELESLSDQELARSTPDVDVYARVSPEHKLRLVESIQTGGHIVAMTGDGVNDAPALKRANVGVAMGIKGTDVSREASEMVLADDNFASIAHAVEEGRTVYDNLRKAIVFILPTNGGEAMTIVAAIAMGAALPITPVQILWVNMITAVTLALSLAFEPTEQNVMQRPPRDPHAALLTPVLAWRVVFVSLIMCAGTFGLFLWMQRIVEADVDTAQTVAVNTLVLFEAFYLLDVRHIDQSVLKPDLLTGNRYVLPAIGLVVLFQLIFTYVPFMHRAFGTAPLEATTWLYIVPVTASVFVLVELEKWLMRLQRRRPGEAAEESAGAVR
ncbi:MAG: cation-transporting P-type ATPase [Phycisphaeraceae bacterium]